MLASVLLISLLSTQTAPATKTATAAKSLDTRAVEAMEKAAQAAQAAAEASLRAAVAAEKAAGVKTPEQAATAAAEPAPSQWSGTVGLGLIWLAGNSKTLTVATNLALQLKTTDWIWGLKAGGAYGEALAAGQTDIQTTAFNGGFMLRGDRRFTEKVTGFIAAGPDFDRVKSIKWRVVAEAGSSITWLEEITGDFTRLQLRTDLAARYTNENRRQYYPMEQDVPDVWSVAPRFGAAFKYGLSKDLTFTEDAEVLPTIVGESSDAASTSQAGRTQINSTSKVAVRLTQSMSFAVALGLKFDSEPAPGKEDLDTALTVGLEVGL